MNRAGRTPVSTLSVRRLFPPERSD